MKARLVIGQIEFEGEGDAAATSAFLRQLVDAFMGPAKPAVAAPTVEAPRLPAPVPETLPARPPVKSKPGRKPGRKARVAFDESPAVSTTAAPAAPRPAPTPTSKLSRREEVLDRIEAFVDKVGSARSAEICKALEIPVGSITSYLKDPRFRQAEDGSYRVD